MDARGGASKLLSSVHKQSSKLQRRREKFDADRVEYNNEKDNFEKERESFRLQYEKDQDQLKQREKSLKERQMTLFASKAAVTQDLSQLKDDSDRISMEEKFVLANLAKSSEILKINVGGKCFVTTTSTIVTNPRSKDSMLSAMFSGRFAGGCKDENGYYFIDRDPEPFELILTYLRCAYVPPESELPRSGMKWKLVMLEVEFYGLRSWQEYVLVQDFVKDARLPSFNNLNELLAHIRTLTDKMQTLTHLSNIHRLSGVSSSLQRVVEDHILEVISSVTTANEDYASFPVPLSLPALERFMSLWNPRTSDPETKRVLSMVRRLMEHEESWKVLFHHLAMTPTMSSSPNAIITKSGTLVTKTQSPNSWTCGVISDDPIPSSGIYDWSIKLLTSCNNLMIGVTKKAPFRTTSSNYSSNTGHYMYCFNGCLYGLSQNSTWQNTGAINTGSVVKVKIDMDKKEIGFDIDSVDKGVAFKNFDTSVPLHVAFDLYEGGCSFELV